MPLSARIKLKKLLFLIVSFVTIFSLYLYGEGIIKKVYNLYLFHEYSEMKIVIESNPQEDNNMVSLTGVYNLSHDDIRIPVDIYLTPDDEVYDNHILLTSDSFESLDTPKENECYVSKHLLYDKEFELGDKLVLYNDSTEVECTITDYLAMYKGFNQEQQHNYNVVISSSSISIEEGSSYLNVVSKDADRFGTAEPIYVSKLITEDRNELFGYVTRLLFIIFGIQVIFEFLIFRLRANDLILQSDLGRDYRKIKHNLRKELFLHYMLPPLIISPVFSILNWKYYIVSYVIAIVLIILVLLYSITIYYIYMKGVLNEKFSVKY